jgi:hypothetical protein
MMKKAAFTDELNNLLKLLPENLIEDYDIKVITEYIEKRIKQIDDAYKNK